MPQPILNAGTVSRAGDRCELCNRQRAFQQLGSKLPCCSLIVNTSLLMCRFALSRWRDRASTNCCAKVVDIAYTCWKSL